MYRVKEEKGINCLQKHNRDVIMSHGIWMRFVLTMQNRILSWLLR